MHLLWKLSGCTAKSTLKCFFKFRVLNFFQRYLKCRGKRKRYIQHKKTSKTLVSVLEVLDVFFMQL